MLLEKTNWSTMGKGEEFRLKLECENANNDDDMILVDGLDNAIIGYTDSWNGASWGRRKFIAGRPHRAVYDHDQSYKILSRKAAKNQKGEQSNDEQPFDVDDDSDYFDENGPIFVKVFKGKNRNLDRGKDLRTQFEEVTDNLFYKEPIIDGFEYAIIGYTDSVMGMDCDPETEKDSNIIGRPTRLVFDRDRCIETLKKKHDTRRKKAVEELESIEEEYLGADTPVFVTVLKRQKA